MSPHPEIGLWRAFWVRGPGLTLPSKLRLYSRGVSGWHLRHCSLLCIEPLIYWRGSRWRERMNKECRRKEGRRVLNLLHQPQARPLKIVCLWIANNIPGLSQFIRSHAYFTLWQSETKTKGPWEWELCLEDWGLGDRKKKLSRTWRKTALTGLCKWGL